MNNEEYSLQAFIGSFHLLICRGFRVSLGRKCWLIQSKKDGPIRTTQVNISKRRKYVKISARALRLDQGRWPFPTLQSSKPRAACGWSSVNIKWAFCLLRIQHLIAWHRFALLLLFKDSINNKWEHVFVFISVDGRGKCSTLFDEVWRTLILGVVLKFFLLRVMIMHWETSIGKYFQCSYWNFYQGFTFFLASIIECVW